MKVFQVSIRTTVCVVLAGLALLSLAACAQHFTLTSPAQVSRLPSSRGMNGGSYVALTPWQYRGSDLGTHRFYYYYNTDNLLHRREVSIPSEAAVLHFPAVTFGSELRWTTLQPDTKAFHFYPPDSPTRR
ncbi:MAG: hypothetical protein ABMA26_26880 [Limisphaerales bacterium]